MTKYYVDEDGLYIGCSDDAAPPESGTVVPDHPIDPLGYRWDGEKYVTYLPKEKALNTIVVTTQAGNTFDGNETARNNMMSAIMAAEIVGQTTSNWKMANNETVLITLDELKEALALSIQRVGEIVLAN